MLFGRYTLAISRTSYIKRTCLLFKMAALFKSTFVNLQVNFLEKTFLAMYAREWTFPGVESEVGLEIGLLGKILGTEGTFVGFLPCVSSTVENQVGLTISGVWADRALVLTLKCHS